MLPFLSYDIYLTIRLLTDNSVYFRYSEYSGNDWDDYSTPTSVYDRNFTFQEAQIGEYNLIDIVTIYPEDELNSFYFTINKPWDANQVIFST